MQPTLPYPPPVTPGPRPGLRTQNLLLGLGTGLVAVAAIVFVAVNWSRLDATVQAGLLFAVTGAAAAATAALARHRMPATAEALGLVTLLLALADAHAIHVGALPQAGEAAYWSVALAVVAGLAWALGRGTGITSARLAAVVLAQAPLLLALDALAPGATVAELAILVQVAVVLELAHRAKRSPAEPRALAAAVATVTWLSVVGAVGVEVALADWLGTDLSGAAAVLAAAAAVAGFVAWRRAEDAAIRVLSLLAASLVGATAVVVAVDRWVAIDWQAPVLGLIAAAVIAAGTRGPARWGRIPAAVEGVVGGLTLLPLLASSGAAVDAAARVTGSAWDLIATTRADTFARTDGLLGAGPTAALLAVAVLLAFAARPVIGRWGVIVAAGAIGLTAVVAAPLLLPLDLVATVVVTTVATVVLAAGCLLAGRRTEARWGLAATTTALGGLTVAWSTATPGLSLAGAAGVTIAAAVLALAGTLHEDRHLAILTAFTTVVAGAVTAGLTASVLGATTAGSLVVGSAVGLALGVVGAFVLDPTGRQQWNRLDGVLACSVEAAGWAAHGAALGWVVPAYDPATTAALVGTGALAAAIHSARPGRRPFAAVAAVEGLAFVWLQLASAGVTTVEAYTLPLAAVLLGAGVFAQRWSARRGELLGSWLVEGPGLVVAFVPTVVLACTDPGLVRPLGGLIAGALVLALGAVTGRKAPVDAGAAVVAVLGLRQLVPVMGDLPSWLIIGATGAFLLALGATFEQRRRQLHDTRARYAALR